MAEMYKDFAYNPVTLDIPRSKMRMKHSHKTTFDTGRLIPIYWREVLPGSTCKMNMAEVTRMQTPIFPIMDNAFIDTYWFFVPNRIIWDHWEEFMGENKAGYWTQPVDYEIPQIKFCSDMTVQTSSAPSFIKSGTNWYKTAPQCHSLADHMGIPICEANKTTPVTKGEFEVNSLPFRAFYQIYNDWFRDENMMLPLDFDKGDADITADLTSSDAEDRYSIDACPLVAKFHDYFTSALPEPQKGPEVSLSVAGDIPLKFAATGDPYASSMPDIDNTYIGQPAWFVKNNNSQVLPYIDSSGSKSLMAANKSFTMTADLGSVNMATINQIRQAFAVQRYYEKLARGGSRYIEILKTMFGVTSPDGRLQRAEYLGGNRKAVNIDQVVQTSSTDLVTPQGNTAAYSLTSQDEEMFTKSFVEHGILMGVQVIRVEHSYQDGLNKMWLRRNEFDYYSPTFANIGEMPIYNKEIFLAGNVTGSKDDEAFGYQEAWAEYRYMNNQISGEMRSDYGQSLDAWHFGDNYSGLPSLHYIWLEENPSSINRNIAVRSTLSDQWLCDIFFEEIWTQPMPVYSVPGLIDHY